MKDQLKLLAIFTIYFILLIGAFKLTAPSESDINRCAETTNYTKAQCKIELGK